MRRSGVQKEVLSLYRSFMKQVKLKPKESQNQIREVIRKKFRENMSIPRYQFDDIEYHLEMGKRKLEQFKSQNVLNVSLVQIRRNNESRKDSDSPS